MNTLPPGFKGAKRIPEALYHADPCREPSLSSSLGKILLAKSPIHAWTAAQRLNPDWQPTTSAAFNIGKAAHREVLGAGGDFVVVPRDLLDKAGRLSTNAAKQWVSEQEADGLTVVKQDVADTVKAMADAARLALEAFSPKIVFDPDHSEIAAFGEIDGCPVRALVDSAPKGKKYLIDFKTCEDASLPAVIRSIERYGYDFQAAHYIDTWEAATGERRVMRFVFQEKSPPYAVQVVQLLDDADEVADFMATAKSKAREARRIWRECCQAGYWPGYPPQIAVVGAHRWHNDEWAGREIGGPLAQKPSEAAKDAARKFMSPEGFDQ